MNEKIENKVKKIWKDHKDKIILTGVAVGTIIGSIALAKSGVGKSEDIDETKIDRVEEENKHEYIPGRNVLMTFSDEDTEEVLWKERCSENYMQDFKDSGMNYKEVRELNGLE